MRLDMFPVALVPPVEDLGGNEDGRKRTGHDANEESERDVTEYPAPKDIKRQCREER